MLSRLIITAVISLLLISCSAPLKRPELKLGTPQAREARPTPPQVFTLDWPVDRARLTQKFKPGGSRRHLGIDLAGPRGTPLLAAHSGRVIYTGSDFSGFGRMVLIESEAEWATLYAHLDKIYVTEGQELVMGDVIGTMGDTGRTTGVHLHFELRKNKKPVDPIDFLPGPTKLASY